MRAATSFLFAIAITLFVGVFVGAEELELNLDDRVTDEFFGGGYGGGYGFGNFGNGFGGGLADNYGYGLRTGYGTGGYGDPTLQDRHVCNAREIDRSKCLETYPDSRGVEWRFIENLGWRKFTGLGSARFDWWKWKNTYRPYSSFSDYTWH